MIKIIRPISKPFWRTKEVVVIKVRFQNRASLLLLQKKDSGSHLGRLTYAPGSLRKFVLTETLLSRPQDISLESKDWTSPRGWTGVLNLPHTGLLFSLDLEDVLIGGSGLRVRGFVITDMHDTAVQETGKKRDRIAAR